MIDLNLTRTVDDLTLAFPSGSEINRVIRYSLRDLLRWLRRQVLQTFKSSTGIAQKRLKEFQRIKVTIGGEQANFWVGLNPLPLHLAGRVSQTSSGVSVNGKSYRGAFFKSIYGSEPKVWVRSSANREFNHPTYRPPKRYSEFSGGASASRIPVEILGAELDSVSDELDLRLEKLAQQNFASILTNKLESFFR